MQIIKKHIRKLDIVRSQCGFTLIEGVIGVALLSVVAVAVLMGVSTSLKTNALADRQSTAMSLALSQVESIQVQPYIEAHSPPEARYSKISGIPENFSIWSINRDGNIVSVDKNGVEGVIGIPWRVSDNSQTITGNDWGLQKITVVIKQGNQVVLELETFKVE
jgi:prepilin-type N-terminal cleavage/methylation domain-containing protein